MTGESSARLESEKVFRYEAARILGAREMSRVIHATKDIPASGFEVEQAVRSFLSSRLPKSYHIGHGHIIDYTWRSSQQIDIVVADNNSWPVLFEAENGAEYFPFESVHAIGEVKSTYYRSQDPVRSFVQATRGMKEKLHRKRIHERADGVYSNPLFCFMFFVNSAEAELDIDRLATMYTQSAVNDLPNMICFLDRGLILNSDFAKNGYGQWVPRFIRIHPEFNAINKIANGRDMWCLAQYGAEGDCEWAHLAMFYYCLMTHLGFSTVGQPNMGAYLMQAMQLKSTQIFVPEQDGN